MDPPGLWTWPAAQALAYLAPATWVQGLLNQHERLAAMALMARCEDRRQGQEQAGGTKRRRAPKGFHNYLVSNLALPDWVKGELSSLAECWAAWSHDSG